MDEQKQLSYYRLEADDVLRQLHTQESGLSGTEVASRIKQYGPNILNTKKREPLVWTYLKQFKDLMIILLLISGGVSMYLDDRNTAIVLWVLAFFNTTIGFMQEFKAGKVMDSLERLVVNQARVMRDGKVVQVPSANLVAGDIVYVEEGDSVPADLRIVHEEELSSNDFALTGESNPSRKFTHAISDEVPLGNRGNLLFMGTTIATGHGFGVVVGTGMRTELGRIATLSQDLQKETSPLQKEMNNIALRVTQGTILLCFILLPLAIQSGLPFKAAFLFAIGIACSVIPNGLPAAISTSLARAAGKLARAKALVKKLSAVESLGATSIICTDKTGTLTKNQMTVEQFLVGSTVYTVNGTGYEPTGSIQAHGKIVSKADLNSLNLFFAAGAMASNARVNPADAEHPTWHCIGDPTEGAVITLGMKAGVLQTELDMAYPELKEFAFDSARKRMSSIRQFGTPKRLYAFVKGAPESILERTTHIWDHGHIRPLTARDRKELRTYNEKRAESALRNLAIAYRILPAGTKPGTLKLDETEKDLVWLGMVSMIDPLRSEVPKAMQAAHKAHIKVSIITGDYAVTAKAIAARAGLATEKQDIIVVTGEELQELSDTQVLALAQRGGVIFSRVAPEDKLRIVELVQNNKQVVAVTGDGINDAPALKRADIGVAMGQTGTDVAKQAAEIVLLDDSFNTLVRTVQEGRVIFQNIKKVTICSFTGNAAELIVNLISLGAATLLGIPLALSIIQILAIDVIAELFPLAALGADKADREVMNERPRNPKDHILNKRSILDLLWCGLLIGGFAYANYYWFFLRHQVNPQEVIAGSAIHMSAMSITYLTLMLCLLANILMRRSQYGLFTRYQLHNKSLWIAMGMSLASIFIIIYHPVVAPYFSAGPLTAIDWLYALSAALCFIAIREFQRWSNKHHSREVVVALHKK